MPERLPGSREEVAIRRSQYMEGAWRVRTNPQNFGPRQVSKAVSAINKQGEALKGAINKKALGIDTEAWNRIYMGIYHHDITIPPELKDGSPHRN